MSKSTQPKKKKKKEPLPTFDDFSPEQVEYFKQVFLSYDKKEEGFVRPKHLPALLRTLNTNPTELFLEQQMNRLTKEFKEICKNIADLMYGPILPERPVIITACHRVFNHYSADNKTLFSKKAVLYSSEMHLEEFLNILIPLLRSTGTDEQIREAFRVFDPDATGMIGVEELRHVLTTLGEPLRPEEVSVFVRMADDNRDGIVNYEEFVTQMFK